MVNHLLFAVAAVSVALLAAPRSHADTTDQKIPGGPQPPR